MKMLVDYSGGGGVCNDVKCLFGHEDDSGYVDLELVVVFFLLS